MKLKCMIVDDEPPARKVLESHVSKVPFLEVAASCRNALEALEYLGENRVDLIFLDLKMPVISGYDFLKTLHNPPAVIITTAFAEYALESYEYNVVDYLMKPISFERFMKAVNKMLSKTNQNTGNEKADRNFIFFKVDKVINKVFFDEILFIESTGNYVTINTESKKMVVYDTLSNIMNTLPDDRFIRTHKSFIVGKRHIESIAGNMIKIHDKVIPIGRSFRASVLEKLEG